MSQEDFHVLLDNWHHPAGRSTIKSCITAYGKAKGAIAVSELIREILKLEHPHEDIMHYVFRFAFECANATQTTLEMQDQLLAQWIDIFLKNSFDVVENGLKFSKLLTSEWSYHIETLEPLLTRLQNHFWDARTKLSRWGDLPVRSRHESVIVQILVQLKVQEAALILWNLLKQDPSFSNQCSKFETRENREQLQQAITLLPSVELSPILLEDLHTHPLPVIRQLAATILAKVQGKEAIVPLLQAMNQDPELSNTVLDLLADMNAQEIVPVLMEKLSSKETLSHKIALRNLSKLQAVTAIPQFIDLLQRRLPKPDDITMKYAISIIRALGQPHTPSPSLLWKEHAQAAIPILLQLFREIRVQIAPFQTTRRNRLIEIEAPSNLIEWRNVLRRLNPPFTEFAMLAELTEVLGRLGATEAIPEFLSLLKKLLDDKEVRAKRVKLDQEADLELKLISALAQLDAKEVIPTLLEIMGQIDEPHILEVTIKAAHQLRAYEAIPLLVTLVDNGYMGVRERASQVLEDLGSDPKSRPYITKLEFAEIVPHYLHASAIETLVTTALVEPTKKSQLIDLLLEMLPKEADSKVLTIIITGLAKLDVQQVVPTLLNMVRFTHDLSLCQAITNALIDLQAIQVIPELLNIVETHDREYGYLPPDPLFELGMLLQQSKEDSCSRGEEPDSFGNHADSKNLQDSAYWSLARQEFIQVLSQLSGHVETIPTLVAELANEKTSFNLRRNVAKALGKMRAIEAIPTLLAIIQKEHPFPSIPSELHAIAAHTLEEIDMGKPF